MHVESTKTKPVAARVPPFHVDVIDRLANREGLTRSQYLAQVIEQGIRRDNAQMEAVAA